MWIFFLPFRYTKLYSVTHIKRKLSSLRPAAESQGNLCFRLLYGCCFRLNSCRAGSEENSGQMLSLGVPSRSER